MATARVDNVFEFYEETAGASTPGVPARTGLVVYLDMDNDRRRVIPAILRFADYAGLEAEWDAGSATTVLDSSIDTHLAAASTVEPLSAAQQSYVATAVTYTAP